MQAPTKRTGLKQQEGDHTVEEGGPLISRRDPGAERKSKDRYDCGQTKQESRCFAPVFNRAAPYTPERPTGGLQFNNSPNY